MILISCSKPAEEPFVQVSFCLSGPETKVTGVSYDDESAVACWSVYVFDVSTDWFRYASSADASPVVLSLKAGRPYRCLALVNSSPEGVVSADDLAGRMVSLADNAPGQLLMYGERTFIPVAGMSEVDLHVKRLVVKLKIQGISVDFSSCPEWTGKTLLLKHLYVTNAYMTSTFGEDPLSVSPARSAWYNTLGWHGAANASATVDALLSDRNINASIDETHPYTTSHCFYFFPNPVEEDSFRTDIWSPRHTRLVIEASIDGNTYYYPIDIPPVNRNCVCLASNVVIHGPGWSHPEGGTFAEATVEVDWNTADAIILD